MPIKFQPNYIITSTMASNLMRVEAAKERVASLSITPEVLRSLRETARLYSTHYSTMIEGNRLTTDQIEAVLKKDSHFPGRERDEHEVKNYYAALAQVEKWAETHTVITEKTIQQLHSLVMTHGATKIKPTPYRDGQNVIREGITRAIVYMPPQASDVSNLMHEMLQWLKEQTNKQIPYPIVGAIIHYQFATIHPYYDGNGRTARLLTTLILHLGGYDLKGIYCLEEYYAQDLNAYYAAISVGPSHNYYMGRAEADITPWIEYFIAGMATSFEKVCKQMEKEQNNPDQSPLFRSIDAQKRKAFTLFLHSSIITSKEIGALFGFQPRTASKLCADWVASGFLEIVNTSNKARTYKLTDDYEKLIQSKL